MEKNKRMDCIFYSPVCQHSLKLLQLLEMIGLKNRFLLISVSNPKFNMPPFVDRVPMLYNRKTNSVYVDDALDEYIGNLSNKSQSNELNDQDNDLLSGSSDFQLNGKFQDNFGFIDENKHIINSSYEYLNDFNHDSINSLNLNNDNRPIDRITTEHVGKNGKFDQRQYESFIQDRDNDIKTIFSALKK